MMTRCGEVVIIAGAQEIWEGGIVDLYVKRQNVWFWEYANLYEVGLVYQDTIVRRLSQM